MRRRNWLQAAALTAAVMIATAWVARAEPTTTIPDDDPSEIPVAATTIETETTLPDESITVTASTEPTTTVDYSATDEYGSTIYAPTTTTTKAPTTTTKKTARTDAPFVVNPAYPNDTDTREPGWRPLPEFYVPVTDEYGNEVTKPMPATSAAQGTTDAAYLKLPTMLEEVSSESFTQPDETQQPRIHWAVAVAAGAVLLAALAGVIVTAAKGRRGDGEDDYIYEDE